MDLLGEYVVNVIFNAFYHSLFDVGDDSRRVLILKFIYNGRIRWCSSLKKYIHSSFYIIISFFFDIYDRVKNIFKHIILDILNIHIMVKDINLSLRNLPKILYFTQLHVTPKPKNFYLQDRKSNTMFSYYDTTLYNSSPNNIDSATSLSALPFKKFFLFFLYR